MFSSVTAAVNCWVTALLVSTRMIQAATPAPTPTLADLAATATASVSAQTAAIGMSQPKVTGAASADARVPRVTTLAAKPSTALTVNTATARVSSTSRSLIGIEQDSSQAGSTPGP